MTMETIIFALNAVLPIVALIALGYGLKRIGFLTEEFVSVGNKLCFKIFLPVMLFMNIYKVKDLNGLEPSFALYAVLGILGTALLGVILSIIFIRNGKQKGVVAQCVVHPNYAIIGVPLASMLLGAEGEFKSSILSAIAIPIFNIVAVIILSSFDNEGLDRKQTIKKTLIKIVKNPLIHGVLLGVSCVAIRQAFGLPALLNGAITDPTVTNQNGDNPLYFAFVALNFVSQATTAVALIVLGGQFEFSSFKRNLKPVLVATIGRTALVPAIFLTLAALLGFKGGDMAAFVAVFSSPVAIVSAIMAREMNADADLAATLVVSTTVASGITVTVAVVLLRALAII